MATAPASLLLQQLRGLAAARLPDKLTDDQLLSRFTEQHEQAAFAALVRRHGPLVLGVCRRVLHHREDAEDAFQATFLVLAKKAGAIARGESVASWLYKVAYRVALRARARTAARQARERQAPSRPAGDPLAEITGRELLTVLDEELQALPECYRAPLVLCYWKGESREEIARQLGWSARTVRRRLEQGRKCLSARLRRRRLELPAVLLAAGLAQQAAAAVPPLLAAAATRVALEAAAGSLGATPAATLASAALAAMRVGQAKTLAAVLLLLAALAAGGAWLTVRGPGPAGSAAAAECPPAPTGRKPAATPAKRPEARKEKPAVEDMTVTGRVLDAAGKPVAGAHVAVVARQALRLSSWERWAWHRNEVVGQVRTNAEGRYRLSVPRTAAGNFRQVRVVAAGPGHGLGWQALDPDARAAAAEVRLGPPQVVRGRLLDLQGIPAAGVKVRVVQVARKPVKGQGGDTLRVPQAGLPLGGNTATSDARGYFTLQGFGADCKLELEINDPRYAHVEEVEIDTGDRKQAEEFRLVLSPPRIVEGRVTCADTGKPVAGARVEVFALGDSSVAGKTDAAGRYRITISPVSKDTRFGNTRGVAVVAGPPPGGPYLRTWKELTWPDGAVVRQTADVALARGVIVRGTITEAGTGRPVAGAYVAYDQANRGAVVSGRDGTYQLAVPAGKNRLIVTSPVPDYIPQVVGSGGGEPGRPVGDPIYFHAVADLDLKAGEEPRRVPITLRRGVTLKGRLVGPDGKPVPSAVLFVGGHRPPYEKTMHPIHVRGGRFEVPGCDPAGTYRLTILEHPRPVRLMLGAESVKGFGQLWLPELLGNKDRLGAAVEVSAAKAAAEPVLVRLAPCGSVRLRLRDAKGQPVARYAPWLQLVVAPGPAIYEALERKTLAAEVVTLAGRYAEPKDLHTDAQGFVTYHGLIPGATYRVKKTRQEPRNDVLKDFKAEAGKTIDVDVQLK